MRRLILALPALAIALALAAVASATAPDQRTFQRQGTQSLDCGTFQDIFTFTTTVHVLTFYDQNGTPVKQVFHVHRVSTDTNSVSGKTLNSSADRIVTSTIVPDVTPRLIRGRAEPHLGQLSIESCGIALRAVAAASYAARFRVAADASVEAGRFH
jgi:hypothetical protein